MADIRKSADEEKLFSGVLRFNAKIWGLVSGIVLGTAIFIVTNWLIIKGGHVNAEGNYVVGPNLQLLSQFFIGYSVTFWGSIVGFFYGFAVGTLSGIVFGLIYNKIVDFRN